jgi:DNA mismatch repair protein MutL
MDELSCFGFELDHFGGNTFLLRSYPAILGDVQWDSFLPELLSELEKGGQSRETLFDRVMKIMACHGALRAGHRMSPAEMTHLITRLAEMDLPTNCPHGRPIFKRITYYEIEKIFKRIV